MFELDKRLEEDTIRLGDFPLSKVLLMDNSYYPWIILVPKRDNIIEITDLSIEDQIQLLKEVNIVAKFLQDYFNPDKLNVGTLGNVVRQFHMHVVARFRNDQAWPDPVWGALKPKLKYTQHHKKFKVSKMIAEIERLEGFTANFSEDILIYAK